MRPSRCQRLEPLGCFPTKLEAKVAIFEDRRRRLAKTDRSQPLASHKIGPIHGRMLRRRAELIRLAEHRRRVGVDVGEAEAWAMIFADTLAFCFGDLDCLTVKKLAADAGIHCHESFAMDAICTVTRRMKAKGLSYQPFHPNAVARMLDVTAEERWACQIRTIGAVDETAEQTAIRQAEDRRARERERGRRRRAAAGAVQRPVYEANSAARTAPWEVLGMSRATWYRKGKPTAPEVAESCPAGLVRQVRPPSYTGLVLSFCGRMDPSHSNPMTIEPKAKAAVRQATTATVAAEPEEITSSRAKAALPPGFSAEGVAGREHHPRPPALASGWSGTAVGSMSDRPDIVDALGRDIVRP